MDVDIIFCCQQNHNHIIHMEPQKNSQVILKNRTKLKPSHFLISMCFNTTIIKTIWYWHKKTHRPKEWRTKKINPYTWQIKIYQSVKNTKMEKNSVFNKWCWENWIFTCKNTKWSKDLNIRPETIKLQEENKRRKASQ